MSVIVLFLGKQKWCSRKLLAHYRPINTAVFFVLIFLLAFFSIPHFFIGFSLSVCLVGVQN